MEDMYVTNFIDYSKHCASMTSFEERIKKFDNPKDVFIVMNCYEENANDRVKLTAILFVMKRILAFNKDSAIKYFPVVTTLSHEDSDRIDYIVCGYYMGGEFDYDEYKKFIDLMYSEFCKNLNGDYIYELSTELILKDFIVSEHSSWNVLRVSFFYKEGNIEDKRFSGKGVDEWFNSDLKTLIRNSLKPEVATF